MSNKHLIAIIGVLVCIGIAGFVVTGNKGVGLSSARSVDLVQMRKVFEHNKMKLNADYLGKRIEITNEFAHVNFVRKGEPIGVGFNGNPVVSDKDQYVVGLRYEYGWNGYLGAPEEEQVYCYFDKSEERALTQLQKGVDVTLTGIFDGEESAYFGVPFKLKDCKIVSVSPHVSQKDSIATLKKEADNGNILAMYYLGNKYYYPDKKKGEKQDFAEAFKYFEKASKKHHDACNMLGIMYLIGEGVKVNYTKALECFKSAAQLGSNAAMMNVANMYVHGNGMNQNLAEARVWFQKALDAGDTNAAKELKKLEGK